MMSREVIKIQNLSKRYSRSAISALSDLSLSVSVGEIYGFLGANGAGKTTTIKILLDLQQASSGAVWLFGKKHSEPSVKSQVGFLPERPYFHDSMRLHQFLDFHRSLFGNSLAGRNLQSNLSIAELVGLGENLDKRLSEFSKGMLQRAGIAQALINDPELIILDEPMSGLDPVGRREMRDLILRLKDFGKTIFLSSHILSDVEQVCDRIAFLERGALRIEGSVADLLKPEGSSYEVVVTGQNLAQAFGKSGNEQRLILHCDSSGEARAVIEKAWNAGGTLISCGPLRASLEEVLFGSGTR